ncbi:MAG: hypothetical protein HFI07_12985 [Lachnospiraceae bacterium]|jgi:hypothetical protein|nr:hypothetical protein [Lachnospiraceae bacterium]
MIIDEKVRKYTARLLGAGILVLAVWFVLAPKKEFSENENRYLTKMPSFTAKTVFSGEYTESLSDWIADHFPMRDLFMGVKTEVEIVSGRREINRIYIGEDNYLIERYEAPENTERITDTLVKFYDRVKDTGVDVRLMLVPTAVTIYEDKLPAYAPEADQMETAKLLYEATGIPAVDCSEKLLAGAQEGQIYYRTDHHWTTFGAYLGYTAYCEEEGIEPVPLEALEAETVTEEFAGTLYSKVNDYTHMKDAITVYTNPEDRLRVTYEDTGEVSDSLYNFDYLQEKDKYSLFLNNIHPLVEIENETAPSDDVLMLIKDSYANSMVPFLTHHYKKIYVFDTRYYKDGPSSFLEEHGEVTDVLILYNMNTLDGDTGIRGIY